MEATDWDARYSAGRMWSSEPNRWVVQELSGVAPGRAIDAACGEGRNAIWLAEQGWSVVAVDFSGVALERARESAAEAAQAAGELDITWVQADITDEGVVTNQYDLALVSYVHLEEYERTPLLRAAARTLAPGGTLLVVGHDASNLAEGYGGPQDPEVLYSAKDVASDLQDMIASGLLEVERADRVAREVDTEDGPRVAWDVLFRARRKEVGKGGFNFG
ncbi:MAG: methyltransferase domain-containing protein [Austwickia sp.]|nr:MAG: methyltransferase domain-containing protein [Austwickia sp.]